ncbi:hypothetical protein VP01_114g2 [Puccinia sorghi]|uniref:Uncharacterized protein n=1 Tax=Puccinia sorghi TaxID=27349 RepID=A0A0L6VT72_9BASI|nr:hypothetical protein VP01_114g2 [Puccinia sorghi]
MHDLVEVSLPENNFLVAWRLTMGLYIDNRTQVGNKEINGDILILISKNQHLLKEDWSSCDTLASSGYNNHKGKSIGTCIESSINITKNFPPGEQSKSCKMRIFSRPVHIFEARERIFECKNPCIPGLFCAVLVYFWTKVENYHWNWFSKCCKFKLKIFNMWTNHLENLLIFNLLKTIIQHLTSFTWEENEEIDMLKFQRSFWFNCTVTLPKHLHMQTCLVLIAAWLDVNCRKLSKFFLKSVKSIFDNNVKGTQKSEKYRTTQSEGLKGSIWYVLMSLIHSSQVQEEKNEHKTVGEDPFGNFWTSGKDNKYLIIIETGVVYIPLKVFLLSFKSNWISCGDRGFLDPRCGDFRQGFAGEIQTSRNETDFYVKMV